MDEPPASLPPAAELYRFLSRALFRLRWATIALLLLLALALPGAGRGGVPTGALLLLFAGYSLLVEWLLSRRIGLRSLAGRVLLDLPAAGLIYLLGSDPGGPLFALLFLAVVCAAATLGLRAGLIYTGAAVALTAVVAPTLPLWSPTQEQVRDLGAQLLILGLTGVGMAILSRRLALEQAAAQAVRDEAARLAEVQRLRADFISTVSHDLRTPFTAVRAGLGMAQSSLADRVRPDEQQLLENVGRNIDRLGILINDLLAFNQFEAGTLQLEREVLDLRAVVTNGIAAIYPLIREKEQTLEVDLPEPLPCRGDPRRLEQVVVNLFDNAHRYTPPGTRIAVAGRRTEAEVRLTVSDAGPGIPVEEREAIFERFHRVATAEGGSGLGLAIARAIVEIHGGRIWAESQPGAGATFHVALPGPQEGGSI
jgi:signal transduction histidine kinase